MISEHIKEHAILGIVATLPSVAITQAAFNALSPPDPGTVYIITDASTVGGVVAQYTAITGNYAVTIADYCVHVIANSPVVTLPSAIGINGYMFVIKNSGAGTATVATTGGQLIDGNATVAVTSPNAMSYTPIPSTLTGLSFAGYTEAGTDNGTVTTTVTLGPVVEGFDAWGVALSGDH